MGILPTGQPTCYHLEFVKADEIDPPPSHSCPAHILKSRLYPPPHPRISHANQRNPPTETSTNRLPRLFPLSWICRSTTPRCLIQDFLCGRR